MTYYCYYNTDPVFTNLPSDGVLHIDENETYVFNVNAYDAENDYYTYSIVGGRDAAFFEIDPHTGVLSFKDAPDFEDPQSGGNTNTYDVTIKVSDGYGGYSTKALWVKVKDVVEEDLPDCIVLEAEDFHKCNFTSEYSSTASDNGIAKLYCHSGSLSTHFDGADGTYKVSLFAQDESDGESTLYIYVDGELLKTVVLDQNDDGIGSNNGVYSEIDLGEVAIEDGDKIEIFAYKDGNEFVRLDKLKLMKVDDEPPVDNPDAPICEDFDGTGAPDNSSLVIDDDHWFLENGAAVAHGKSDGKLVFAEIDVEGQTKVSFDVKTKNVDPFEANDEFKVQIKLDGGAWETVDVFTRDGDVFVGSNTGQVYGETFNTVGYVVGDADTETVQLRVIADFSWQDEFVVVDNVCFEEACEDTKVTFDDQPAGTVVSTQFAGFTVSAQRKGDSDSSENDAMLFDTNNTTGGDGDLGYTGKGQVIIISEDNDSSDPDDNAAGGTITFDFDTPSSVTSIEVLDIEETTGTIDLFDASGDLIKTVAIPRTGNNGEAVVFIDADDVKKLVVNLPGSGAVNDLCFKPGDVVDPGTASLGNFVFFDENGDGVFNGDDTAVEGVTVELLDDTGAVIATDVTDANGEYLFENLNAGDYQVQFDGTTTGGLEFTTQSTQAADAVNNDSDADANGLTSVVTLDIGEAERDVDAGLVDPGTASLSGRYFCDVDADDLEDAPTLDKGVAGVTVTLNDANGNAIATTTTDADGNYLFENLDAGTYSVTFPAPTGADAGKVFVSPNEGNDDTVDSDAIVNSDGTATTGQVTLEIGEQSTDNDAGIVDPGTAELGNFVFLDKNEDGLFNGDDEAVEDVLVELFDADTGNSLGTQRTDANGNYLFTNLMAGNYQVGFTAPAGLAFTVEAAGAADADGFNNDSDADVITGLTDVIELSIGESELFIDAGLIAPNEAPVAVDDMAKVCAPGGTLMSGDPTTGIVAIDVVDNDTDADNDTLTVAEINGTTVTVGDFVTLASGATVTLNSDGDLVYDSTAASYTVDTDNDTVPDTTFAADELLVGLMAMESFEYTITDGNGETSTATVDVEICGATNTLETIAASLPTTVEFTIGVDNVDGFTATLLAFDDGNDFVTTSAYCVDFFGTLIAPTPAPVLANVYLADADSVPDGTVVNEDNLDIINFLLNQDLKSTDNFLGMAFTEAEIQSAFWFLSDGIPSISFQGDLAGPDDSNPQSILDSIFLAQEALVATGAEGFVAGEGDKVGLILDPVDGQEFTQNFIVGIEFSTLAQDCIC